MAMLVSILSLLMLVFNNVFDMLQSAKTNLNVEQVFFSIARDIKQRLAETDSKPEVEATFFYVKISQLSNFEDLTCRLVAGSDHQDKQTGPDSCRWHCCTNIVVLWFLRVVAATAIGFNLLSHGN